LIGEGSGRKKLGFE